MIYGLPKPIHPRAPFPVRARHLAKWIRKVWPDLINPPELRFRVWIPLWCAQGFEKHRTMMMMDQFRRRRFGKKIYIVFQRDHKPYNDNPMFKAEPALTLTA